MDRINGSLLAKNDSMVIETILHTLDQDKDGVINVEDVLAVNKELGTNISETMIVEIMEKITMSGNKIEKVDLTNILFWVLAIALLYVEIYKLK